MGAPIPVGAAEAASTTARSKKMNADIKRAFLAASTLGTSEIKTGGGEYGDETVADSLFPKSINDLALDERTDARKATDAAKLAAAQPGPVPDLADKLLQGSSSNSLLRQQTRQGRRSTFLSGALGLK